MPDIAWTTPRGELWLAGAGIAPFQVVETGACCAVFSPAGSRLAYLAAENNGQKLMIIDLSQPTVAQAIDALPPNALLGYLRWQDENRLWLNTFYQNPNANLLETDWSLWQVDAASGRVMPNTDKGVAFPAPDGRRFAIVNPSVYGADPATLTIFSSNGLRLGKPYEYPAISSASHLAWLPNLHWGAEDTIHFALPAPDLVYAFEQIPSTKLIAFQPSDGASVIGEIITPYPADVLWSPDGEQVAFLSPPDAAGSQRVIVHTIATGEEQILMTDAPLGSLLLEWNTWLLVNANGSLHLWSPSQGSQTFTEVWGVTHSTDGGLALLMGLPQGKIVHLEDGTQTTIADNLNPFPITLAGGIR